MNISELFRGIKKTDDNAKPGLVYSAVEYRQCSGHFGSRIKNNLIKRLLTIAAKSVIISFREGCTRTSTPCLLEKRSVPISGR